MYQLSKEYLEETLIKVFSPLVQLEKPLSFYVPPPPDSLDDGYILNNKDWTKKFYSFQIKDDDFKILYFRIYYPRESDSSIERSSGRDNIYVQMNQELEYNFEKKNWTSGGNTLVVKYQSTRTKFKGKRRIVQQNKDKRFLNTVLNIVTRFINTVLLDYSYMISEPLRSSKAMIDIAAKTGRPTPFLGPAEELVASFLGAKGLVKDGFEKSSQKIKEEMEKTNYFKKLSPLPPSTT